MESEGGRGWIIIIALVLLGIGIALFLASKASEAEAQERRAIESHRQAIEHQLLLQEQFRNERREASQNRR